MSEKAEKPKHFVEARLVTSKRFPPGISHFDFSIYKMMPLPTEDDHGGECVVAFYNLNSGGTDSFSNPFGEIDIVCSIISVLLNTTVEKKGVRIAESHIPKSTGFRKTIYSQFYGDFDFSKFSEFFPRIYTIDDDLLRQFVRSCSTYSFAINFIPKDITFAFFLLVVAVECLSSQKKVISESELDLDSKKCERYVRFIDRYLMAETRGEDENNKHLFIELLKTIYYAHRSGFVHGGREVSHAAVMADQEKSSYFKHELNGKEVKTPGIGWFANIVRNALLGFLKTQDMPDSDGNLNTFARIAIEQGSIKMKVKRAVEKGEPVNIKDIEFR